MPRSFSCEIDIWLQQCRCQVHSLIFSTLTSVVGFNDYPMTSVTELFAECMELHHYASVSIPGLIPGLQKRAGIAFPRDYAAFTCQCSTLVNHCT